MKESPISEPKSELEKQAPSHRLTGPPPFDHPILCLVVDRNFSRLPIEVAVSQAVQGGIDWIQLRERELDGQDWLEWATGIAQLARKIRPEIEIIVNRRIDVALAIEASGAHLGFDAVTPSTAREILGKQSRIGASLHSPTEATGDVRGALDYCHLAPIFDPLSKEPERPALGFESLRRTSEAGIPTLAQGGITAENAHPVIQAGARGIAVTGSILGSWEPGEVTASLRQALDSAPMPGDQPG
ncbi:MAG: thiamine phosphate synthase [Myxococcota bacterium]|nr:thiamine phosphate synthase [Myxococcota bacterium]